jgi:hypothetical protein
MRDLLFRSRSDLALERTPAMIGSFLMSATMQSRHSERKGDSFSSRPRLRGRVASQSKNPSPRAAFLVIVIGICAWGF